MLVNFCKLKILQNHITVGKDISNTTEKRSERRSRKGRSRHQRNSKRNQGRCQTDCLNSDISSINWRACHVRFIILHRTRGQLWKLGSQHSSHYPGRIWQCQTAQLEFKNSSNQYCRHFSNILKNYKMFST
jgi:hypothetical protein